VVEREALDKEFRHDACSQRTQPACDFLTPNHTPEVRGHRGAVGGLARSSPEIQCEVRIIGGIAVKLRSPRAAHVVNFAGETRLFFRRIIGAGRGQFVVIEFGEGSPRVAVAGGADAEAEVHVVKRYGEIRFVEAPTSSKMARRKSRQAPVRAL
jgi:hypothetical protein